ncbi:MAG: histidine kinase N-terminal 7TM domain-containing protein, partial [bacterium]
MPAGQTPHYLNAAIYIGCLILFNVINITMMRSIRRRSVYNALSLFLLFVTIWIIGSAGEEYFGVAANGMFWTKIKSVGAILCEPAWFLAAIVFSGVTANKSSNVRRFIPLIFVVPAICLAGALTDGRHHFYFGSLNNGFGNGPLFYIRIIYGTSLLVAGLIIISGKLFETHAPNRHKLIMLLSVFILMPMIGRSLVYRGLLPPGSPVSPLLTSAGAIACMIGAKWFSMMRWLPVSISEVVESMPTGLVVIDRNGELITLNPAAARLIGLDDCDEFAELIESLSDKFSMIEPRSGYSFDLEHGGKTLRFQRIELQRTEEDVDTMIISIVDVSGERSAQKEFV